MSNLSPPPSREKLPVVKDQGGKTWAEFPFAWQKWFSDIKELLAPVATSGLFPWSSISKIGSNLTDLLTRNHADLQNINTATYTHLSSTQATDLTDAGDSELHYHASDRSLANTTGLGTGVGTALAVNVGTAGSPVVNGGALGTPSSGVGTNLTGTAAGLTAGNVTTNANLTGHVTSVGNAAVLGSFTLAELNAAVSDANVARTDAANSFTGIQTITDLTAGFLVKGQAFANEGGEFLLERPLYAGSTTTLNGNVTFDINVDSLRVFETGGTDRGFFINIANCAAGATTQLATGGGTVTGTSSGTNTGDDATNSQYSGLAASKQNVDATLTSIAALGTAADKIAYTTGVDTWAETALTSAARTVLDDTTVSAMVDTLGGAASTGTGGLVRATSPTFAGTINFPTSGYINNDNATWGAIYRPSQDGSSASHLWTRASDGGAAMYLSSTGELTLVGTPSVDAHAATKGYVDGVLAGFANKISATVATTAALPANTYSNGTAGVGATLTADAVGVLTIDTHATVLNDIILVKDEASGLKNGVYTVTTAGTAGVAYVLTRHTSIDTSGEYYGAGIFTTGGSANLATTWTCITNAPTVGTTAIVFTQSGASVSYSAGSGLTLTGAQFSVNTSTVPFKTDDLSVFAATTSAQLRGVISDETGTGLLYFQGGALGTPASGVATNLTGTAAGLTAGTATNQSGGSVAATTITGSSLTITGATDLITYSKGGSGYGAHYVQGSGTNNSYHFMGNVTSGEQGRITSTNAGDMIFGVGNAATTVLSLAAGAASVTGTLAATSTVSGTQLISSVATGTAPLTVASTTEVANLKAATATLATNVTTNANLTGHITSVGNAASLGSFTIAQLNTAISDADVALVGGSASQAFAVSTLTAAGNVSGANATGTQTNAAVVGVASSIGQGVYGASTGGVGVYGNSTWIGVQGQTSNTGGAGVYGSGNDGYGVVAEGDTTNPINAAFRIVPQNAVPSGPNAVGDIYVTTAGVLKICTVAGSPGTWVSVGAQT